MTYGDHSMGESVFCISQINVVPIPWPRSKGSITLTGKEFEPRILNLSEHNSRCHLQIRYHALPGKHLYIISILGRIKERSPPLCVTNAEEGEEAFLEEFGHLLIVAINNPLATAAIF